MDRTTPTNSPEPPKPAPTVQAYLDLQMVFVFLNGRLFNFALPNALLTFQRKSGAGGYFWGNRFVTRNNCTVVHEIALNPSCFAERTDTEIVAILAHEMAHLWQHHCSTPPKRAYHDKVWAAKMISIGLVPSHTGAPNGRKVGAKMSHYIEPGGLFDVACRELLANGTVITYVERVDAARQKLGQKKRDSKTPFVCPGCRWQIWGKPDTRVRCDGCNVLLVAKAKP